MHKRLALLFLLFVLIFTASTCKKSTTQNTNQQTTNQPSMKAGKWIPQWRSPAAQNAEGLYLAAFTYTCLAVISPSVVYAAGDIPKGENSRIGIFTRTTDGGASWTETELTRPDMNIIRINSMSFVSHTTGWLVGFNSKNEGIVLKTTDAGTTWETTKLPVKQTPQTVCFTDENTGWIGGTSLTPDEQSDEEEDKLNFEGNPSDLLATSDGGKTWQSTRRMPISISDIFFLDKTTGWMTGQKGIIYKTADGGRTWDTQKSELETGEGAMIDMSGDSAKKFRVIGIHFSDAENGFAAAISGDNSEGRIIATVNGGASWSKKFMGGDFGFRDAFFVNSKVGWVLPDYGHYIYYTIDGGSRWLSEVLPFDQDIPFFRIQGADEKHVWAAAGGAIFFRTEE